MSEVASPTRPVLRWHGGKWKLAPRERMTDITQLTNPRHSWMGEQRISALDAVSHCNETWRACVHCGVIKVTVHPPVGHPYRAWNFRDRRPRQIGGPRPECTGPQ